MTKRSCLALALICVPVAGAAQEPALDAGQLARIDSLFAAYAVPGSAGCALGLSRFDTVVLEKAWGRANLEFDVPITPATIFEAGSVSKQFTAAAVLRLAQQGRLSLDDDVRKHVPELPAYETPITIRHLLTHTSGLRDWGTLMSFAGWPRGTRLYTHAHVLDIIRRQTALNHPVGAEYLYSNSNYNLLAIIAERVSGKSLAEFTRTELFEPLGMTSTGWRDDFTRVVPGRAQAYGESRGQWRLQMPNENIYGNSSLLTTVGDLLKWSANFAHGRVGGPEFTAMQLQRGRLTSGREILYAAGVFVDDFGGTREIWHDGATAGYRAFFARYPDVGWTVGLLCNAGNVNPTVVGRRVSAIVTGRSPAVPTPPADSVGQLLPAARLARLAGDYRSLRNDEPLHLVAADGRLRLLNGPALIALNERHFTSRSGRTQMQFDLAPSGEVRRVRVWVDDGDTTAYVPAGAPRGRADLGQYVGAYVSDEADVTLWIARTDTNLVLRLRPDTRVPLAPIYADGFTALGTVFRFTRNGRGNIDGILLTAGRARNVPFVRMRSAEVPRMLQP